MKSVIAKMKHTQLSQVLAPIDEEIPVKKHTEKVLISDHTD